MDLLTLVLILVVVLAFAVLVAWAVRERPTGDDGMSEQGRRTDAIIAKEIEDDDR
jgi:hypothetical protein